MVVVSDNLEFSSGLLFLLTVIVKCSAQTLKKLANISVLRSEYVNEPYIFAKLIFKPWAPVA